MPREDYASHIDPQNGKVLYTGYMNIYRSGWFHSAGKPGMFDRHPGDLYPTYQAAISDIDMPEFYVTTTTVTWYDEPHLKANPPDSQRVGLALSRQAFRAAQQAKAELVEV